MQSFRRGLPLTLIIGFLLAACSSGALPSASFTVEPTNGDTGTEFTFDASASTGGRRNIFRYTWDFGDGSGEQAQANPVITHTFTSDGSYTVTLTVTNGLGDEDTSRQQVNVERIPPTASFTVSPSSADTTTEFTFDAAASSGGSGEILLYTWDLGDGSAEVARRDPTLSHTFNDEGSYSVTLTVTNTHGDEASSTQDVTVGNAPPVASFTVSEGGEGNTNTFFLFDASDSSDPDGDIVSYDWDFGDGTTRVTTEPQASHQYQEAGSYTVTLTVTDNEGATASAETTVEVTELDDLCTEFEGNNSLETAAPIEPGVIRAAICEDGQRDFFQFTLNESVLINFIVAEDSLGSALISETWLYYADGTPIASGREVFIEGSGFFNVLDMYLPAGTYFISVEDAFAESQQEDSFYELSFALSPVEDVMFEAAVGIFAGQSNHPNIADFEGTLMALSARHNNGDVLAVPALVNISDPALGDYFFVYPAEHGVVFFTLDLHATINSNSAEVTTGMTASPYSSVMRYAPPSLEPRRSSAPLSISEGTFVFELPTETVTRTVTRDETLSVPTVTSATVVDDGAAITVAFETSSEAISYKASAFGRRSGAAGETRGVDSPLSMPLGMNLEPAEAFVVSVRASNHQQLDIPLPETQLNLSEYLFYSDAQQ